ncbi:MAG: hypothetical protein LBT88_02410 [Oscillospiraceae bacterium]|jgi:hypothetical protein|nr:hypothetical protein [Oscillospiraceae bacterium]
MSPNEKNNLYESFKNLPSPIYYGNDQAKPTELKRLLSNFLDCPSPGKAYDFIEEYFVAVRKGAVFHDDKIPFNRDDKKHIHTVSLYLLGVCIQEVVEPKLQKFAKKIYKPDKVPKLEFMYGFLLRCFMIWVTVWRIKKTIFYLRKIKHYSIIKIIIKYVTTLLIT